MRTEIGLSMVSSIYERTVARSLAQHIQAAGDAGFAGIEFHPTRQAMREVRLIPHTTWEGLLSVHQSVRKERIVTDVLHHERSALDAALSMALFEHQDDSMSELLTLKTGQDRTPLVHFPDSQSSPTDTAANPDRWEYVFQPKGDLAAAWDASTLEELVGASLDRGYEWCLDLHHWRRVIQDPIEPQKAYRLPKWQELLKSQTGAEIVQKMVRMVHIGPGRPDNELPGVDGPKELESLIKLGRKGPPSELVDMLTSLAEIGWERLIVIETPARAIAKYLGYSKVTNWRMDPKKLYKVLEQVRKSVDSIFAVRS